MTSGRKFVGVQHRLFVSALGEEDQGEPITQGEEVCLEAQGVVRAVPIEQIGVAKSETRLELPGQLNQRLNR